MNTDYSTFTTNFAAFADSVNPSQDELCDLGSSSASSPDSDFNHKDNFSITASSENHKIIFSNLCPETVVRKKVTKDKKTYPCPKCLKSFDRPSALETHSYTHTSEKPFQCQSPGCGRRFSVVSNLRRHFKIHQKPSSDKKITSKDRQRYVRQLIEKKDTYLSLLQQQNSSNAYGMNYATYNTMYASLSPTAILQDNYYCNSQDIMEQTHQVEDYAPQNKQYRPVRPVPRPHNSTVIQSNVDSNYANKLHNKNYNSNRHVIAQKDFNMKKSGVGTNNVFAQASVSNQNLPVSWFGHAKNFTCLSEEYFGGQTTNIPESSLSPFGDFCFLRFPEIDHTQQQGGSSPF